MKLRGPRRESHGKNEAELDYFAKIAAELVALAERHGCNSLTAHSPTGVWRVSITKVSGRAADAGGNYQRSSLPRR